jgi:hypothetical protein
MYITPFDVGHTQVSPPVVILGVAGNQACLWYKTVFCHLYEMLIFLNISLGSCYAENDNRGTL